MLETMDEIITPGAAKLLKEKAQKGVKKKPSGANRKFDRADEEEENRMGEPRDAQKARQI